jgi:hypothetical protein
MNSVCPQNSRWLDATFPGEFRLNLILLQCPCFFWEITANDPALLENISKLQPTCSCNAGIAGWYRSNNTCIPCPEFAMSPKGGLSIGECKCIQEFCGNISTPTDVCSPCPDAREPEVNSISDSPAMAYYSVEVDHLRSYRISSSHRISSLHRWQCTRETAGCPTHPCLTFFHSI